MSDSKKGCKDLETTWADAEEATWVASRGRWSVSIEDYKRQREAVAEARRKLLASRDVLFARLLDATMTALAASKLMQRRKYNAVRRVTVSATGLEVTQGSKRVAHISLCGGQVVLVRTRHGMELRTGRDIEHADPIILSGLILESIRAGAFAPMSSSLIVAH